MRDLIAKPKSEMEDILRGHGLRELWQTFMTGNYYYCFECQAQCPAGHGLRELWQTFMTGNYYYCFECQAQCPATNLPQQNQ
jgi:hypothetical protein